MPAIRAAVAEELSNEYNYTQEEIASSLGIVQVAVSKYLNKKYSSKIAKLKNYIKEKGLAEDLSLIHI